PAAVAVTDNRQTTLPAQVTMRTGEVLSTTWRLHKPSTIRLVLEFLAQVVPLVLVCMGPLPPGLLCVCLLLGLATLAAARLANQRGINMSTCTQPAQAMPATKTLQPPLPRVQAAYPDMGQGLKSTTDMAQEFKRRQPVVRQGQEQWLGSGQGQRQEEGQPVGQWLAEQGQEEGRAKQGTRGQDGQGSEGDVCGSCTPGCLHCRLLAMSQRRAAWSSCFRGGLMLFTCCAILAVDFRAFPRRYAKTQAWGTGLMDVGVGGILLAAGLVAAAPPQQQQQQQQAQRQRGVQQEGHGQQGEGERQEGEAMGPASTTLAYVKALGWVTGGPKVSGCAWRLVELLGSKLLAGLRRGVRAALPSWLLWAVRLLSVRALDYQEVVWEYGVHWNFFATIALVSLACALLGPLTWRQAAGAALLLTALHQAALQWGGWGAWALSDERPAGLGPCPLLPSLLALWPFSSGNGRCWGAVKGPSASVLTASPCPTLPCPASDHLQSLHGASEAMVAWLRQLAGLNREGLVSLPGYIALRLVGQALGGGLRSTWAWAARRTSAAGRQLGRGRTRHPAPKPRSTADTMLGHDDGVLGQYATGIQRGEAAKPEAGVTAAATVTWGEARPALEAFVVWGVVCGALWLLLLLAEVCLQPVSRRTCNLAYVVWIAALCVTLLLPLAAAQVLLPTGLRPSLPLAVSQNMLPVFLAANLTTGAVNMGCDTMQVGPGQARAIVMAHMGLVVAIAWLLDRSDVVLKI
ncbi:hypothetical protein QJQ45_019261, partial [Haematococcus lacustris]